MRFIQPDIVHGPGLAVSQDDGLADKLGLSPVEFDKDGGCSCFGDWHGAPLDYFWESSESHMKSHIKAFVSWPTRGKEMTGGTPHRAATLHRAAMLLSRLHSELDSSMSWKSDWCRGSEVLFILPRVRQENFRTKTTLESLISSVLSNPKFAREPAAHDTNFGFGTLAPSAGRERSAI